MSEILGYDVNGRPLRAGDRVVLFRCGHPEFDEDVGRIFTVRDRSSVFSDSLKCDERLTSGWSPADYSLSPKTIRRIDDRTDHQPSEYTFDSLMDHLKSGVPA